jgi:hypothetical protein
MRKVGFMRKLGFIIGIIVLLMAVVPVSNGLSVQADSGWYWKPGNFTDYAPSGMPDFDQKQDMWRIPPVGGNWSYCGPVAVANSLWWFDSANEPFPQPPSNISDHYGLVTNFGNQWDDHDPQNVMPLVNALAWLMDTDGQRTGIPHNGTDVHDMEAGIDQYLNITGYAAAYNETTLQWPDFYWIREEVEKCQDVVLLLGFYNRTETEPGKYYYERIGGHYVTCAGVNLTGNQTGISDPYYDNAEAGGPGIVVPVAHNHTANGTGTHNDTLYVSHDIYNVTRLMPGPGGPPCWALLNYTQNITNFIGQNGGGWPIPGPVVTIIDYAVDVSPTATYNLTMAVNGNGTTTPAVGSYSYPAGTVVNITATAGGGWQFVNWTTANIAEIANATAASTTVNVDENKTVTANFVVSPGWYWKPGNWTDYAPSGMPDFDQKQDQWTDPMGNWTYCGPVAVANSLWWFDSANEPSPVAPPAINDHYGLVTNFSAPWDDHDPQNVIPLVNNLSLLMNTGPNGTNVMDMQAGIDQYLNITGYAADYNETTLPWPGFYWIEEEVERCQDVVLLLGFYYNSSGYYERIGGHYVTCAGVNSGGWQLGISDPYYDNAEAGGPGIVVPVAHNHTANGTGTHNDTLYVSHDIYNVTQVFPTNPGMPSCWALQNYALGKNISNFAGQNGGGFWIAGPVETIIDYAVDVSPTAVNATLQGHVDLKRKYAAGNSTWETPLVVRFFDNATHNETAWSPINITTDAYGNFTATGVGVGTYDVGVKNWTCLSRMSLGKAFSAGNTTTINFTTAGVLTESDTDNNDQIILNDFNRVLTKYGLGPGDPGWNAMYDFDRSGVIDLADYNLVLTKYGQVGDIYQYPP